MLGCVWRNRRSANGGGLTKVRVIQPVLAVSDDMRFGVDFACFDVIALAVFSVGARPPATTLRLKATNAETGKDPGGVAQLHAIQSDRVILDRNGRLETLPFPETYDSGSEHVPFAVSMTLPPTAVLAR